MSLRALLSQQSLGLSRSLSVLPAQRALSFLSPAPARLHIASSPSSANRRSFHVSCTMSAPKAAKSESEWRAVLTPAQFKILREKGTEPAYTGEYDKHYPKQGVYACAGCGTPLYTANTKFNSGCGWPAFFDAIPGAVSRHEDNSFGMRRVEITCTACGGHLGHVFEGEGFPTPTDERHCVNSISLKFHEDAPKPSA